MDASSRLQVWFRELRMASSIRGEARLQSMTTELFPVPLTLEGASVLHQVARFRWPEWRNRQTR